MAYLFAVWRGMMVILLGIRGRATITSSWRWRRATIADGTTWHVARRRGTYITTWHVGGTCL